MTTDQGRELDLSERVRLMRDGLINNSAFLVSGLVGILLVPIMLQGLGASSYGFWIAALAVARMAGVLDLGLGWSVVRETAATGRSRTGEETALFVTSVGNVYVVLGIVGAMLIGIIGLPLSRSLDHSSAVGKIAPIVFGLAGLVFFAEHLLFFASAVLGGLRRFDLDNRIWITVALLRAAGIIALLGVGATLMAVAAWYFLATAVTAFAALRVVGRLQPRFRLLAGGFNWSPLYAHLRFGLMSMLANAASGLLWETMPLLIGVVRGPAAIVPYHIGQRFPLAVSGIVWRTAVVLFPAASEHERAMDMGRTRVVLEVGTRWIIVLALPVCLVLWILAPNLLQAWLGLGQAPPETVLVLRLTAAAVLADALGTAALHVLWGGGAARTVLLIQGAATVAGLALTLALLSRTGVVGAVWGVFLAASLASSAFLYLAARSCGTTLFDLLRGALKGMLLSTVACAATAVGITYLASPDRWVGVVGTALVSTVAYMVSLHLRGAREEERIFTQEILRLPSTIARSACRGIQRALGRVG